MRMRFAVVLAMLAFVTLPRGARAAAPAVIPIQGFLTDAAGTPLNGDNAVKVSLYATLDAAVPLFSETKSVRVTQGYFTLLLGSDLPLDLSLFQGNSAAFVGISIGTGAEMAPRLTVGTTPFAAFAQYAGEAATLAGLAPADLDALYASTSHLHDDSYAAASHGHPLSAVTGIREGALAPTGTITMFGGATAPPGYLLCDGTAVSRETYADLFAVIGTAYGTGDGSTTFNLPDLRTRVAVGLHVGWSQFAALGRAGGEASHYLSWYEMPSHNHTATTNSDGAHTHSVSSTSWEGSHSHTVPVSALQYSTATAPRSGATPWVRDANVGWYDDGMFDGLHFYNDAGISHFASDLDWLVLGSAPTATSSASSGHGHTATTASSTTHSHAVTTASAGGGSAMNQLQPYVVVNYVIKY